MVNDLRYTCIICQGEFLHTDTVIYNKEIYCIYCYNEFIRHERKNDKDNAVAEVTGVMLLLAIVVPSSVICGSIIGNAMLESANSFSNKMSELNTVLEGIEFKQPEYNNTGNETNNYFHYYIPEIINDAKNETILLSLAKQNTTGIITISYITLPYLDFTTIEEPP